MTISPWRTGVAVGAVLGLWHLLWSICVAFGAASAILDFVMWIHFIDVPIRIAPFSAELAGLLILVTTALGFGAGYVFAAIWNWLHGERGAAGAAATPAR